MEPGVTCVGGAVLDRKLHLLGPAVRGTSNPARADWSFGGVARNVAENLAGLGVAVRLVSAVGDDPAGQALVAQLAAAGVDGSAVARVAGAATAEYTAVLLPDGDLELGVAAMDVLARVGVEQVDAALGRSPAGGWLFADGNLRPDVLASLVAAARKRPDGPRLAVDAVSVPKVTRLPGDLHGVAVLFCNRDEARAWVAHHRPGEEPAHPARLARRLVAAGAAVVVLTDGPDGVTVADAGGVHTVAAVPARPVDVTGAGDALVAGTLAGLLEGLAPERAVARGTLVAALTVESGRTVRPDLAAALRAAREQGRGTP